jgi:hypothetical protein
MQMIFAERNQDIKPQNLYFPKSICLNLPAIVLLIIYI